MIPIEAYMNQLIRLLRECFGQRLRYVGLQGSYLRNEADESSDIDVMVLLDALSIGDLDTYRSILMELGHYERSCGFLCGEAELRAWNPLEICHLVHTTRDYYGRLTDYVPPYTAEDEKNFVLLSLNNLFHELCHRYVHASRQKNIMRLPASYKQTFFLLQNIHYLQTGVFAATRQELLSRLQGEERKVLEISIQCKSGPPADFEHAFGLLFRWCQKAIQQFRQAAGGCRYEAP